MAVPAVGLGGVLFIGATVDPHLRAFATADGRERWKTRLPTSARATPLVYTLPDGREMVAVAAGGHDRPLSKPGTTLHAFALPGRRAPTAAACAKHSLSEIERLSTSSTEVHHGQRGRHPRARYAGDHSCCRVIRRRWHSS